MDETLKPLMTSKKQDWLTPIWLFDLLNEEFHFNTDAAATAENTLCDDWFDEKTNGLEQLWIKRRIYCNPPYRDAGKWMEKAHREVFYGFCPIAVLLVAARTDVRWMWEYARKGEIRLLPGRLKFDHADGARFSAPFPSAVVIFEASRKPQILFWDIRESK